MIERILIVGYGSIGKRHLYLARQLFPNADIRVLRQKVTATNIKYANGFFSDFQEALNFSPQIAIIANPAPFHISTAQALAQIGVHLLVEKPLSISCDGIRRLIEICQNQNLILLTGYNLRYLPSLQEFRTLLGKGIVGKVLSVRCEIGQHLPSWRPDDDYRKSVSSQFKLGGGALLELSHELDYLRWIFGECEWVKANLSRQSNLEIDVEDTAHLILGLMPTADGHQLICSVDLDFIRHDATRLCIAIGKKGSLRWNGITGTVEFYGAGDESWSLLFSQKERRDESYLTEWKNFIAAIENRDVPLINGEDGLKVVQIIEAAREASSSGGRVNVQSLPRL